jgi:hypothetical protein
MQEPTAKPSDGWRGWRACAEVWWAGRSLGPVLVVLAAQTVRAEQGRTTPVATARSGNQPALMICAARMNAAVAPASVA